MKTKHNHQWLPRGRRGPAKGNIDHSRVKVMAAMNGMLKLRCLLGGCFVEIRKALAKTLKKRFCTATILLIPLRAGQFMRFARRSH